jgi:hypothetical protein
MPNSDDFLQGPVQRMTAEQASCFRDLLVQHGNEGETGKCAECGVRRCRYWRNAYDQLAIAGELMAAPDQWRG